MKEDKHEKPQFTRQREGTIQNGEEHQKIEGEIPKTYIIPLVFRVKLLIGIGGVFDYKITYKKKNNY
ncbi:MAG: hypothetical protein ACOC44_01980 [Promethearchaeia archaeon]